ncbi:type III secretion system stator protein SctL [Paraburkholderia sp. B3]|uniref:type III secretion system stator protein SctL n=1 Tax=Paraburkholderia sp. B3 TaxID=3134791 RepID=UPI0039820A8A
MAIWLRNARREEDGTAGEPGSGRVGAGNDILSAAEFGALVSLDEGYRQLADDRDAVLAAARDEAARVIAAGEARAAELVEAARREREQAAAEGYRHGEQTALADWIARVAQAGDARALMHARMRERLASVVQVAVEKIVAVQQRDLLFERALAEVDRIADGAAYLSVTVHPNDHAHAQAAFDRLAVRWRELGQAFPISVVADRRVEPGSCVAESDVGAIDASLETQLRAMRDAVARALKRAAQASERTAISATAAATAAATPDERPDPDPGRDAGSAHEAASKADT